MKTWNERIDHIEIETCGRDPFRLIQQADQFCNNLDFDALAERIIDQEALEREASESERTVDEVIADTIAQEALAEFCATCDDRTTGLSELSAAAIPGTGQLHPGLSLAWQGQAPTWPARIRDVRWGGW